jgi:serine/threonine-protein kinase RsbW
MAFLKEQGVEARACHHVALVLDEVLTNLGTHGNCLDKPATIRLTVGTKEVSGEIVDVGPPFDPREAPDPSFDLTADERPVGGLGLYLVRKLSCALEYARENEENHTRFAIARGVE